MARLLASKRSIPLIAFALLVCAGAEVAAQTKIARPHAGAPGTWRLLGTVNANLAADHDVIIVQGPYDFFRRIKFKVTHAPVKVHALVVVYENGEPDRLETRFEIPQGGESRVIDLRGSGERKLRKVELWYDTAGAARGRADVTLFGEK